MRGAKEVPASRPAHTPRPAAKRRPFFLSSLPRNPLADPLLRLFYVAVPRSDEGSDDAVQGAQLLSGQLRALEEVAQIADHAGALVLGTQEAAAVELLLEMAEEAHELLLGGRLGMAGDELLGRRVVARGEPLVAHQQHRLRQVERGEGRVER